MSVRGIVLYIRSRHVMSALAAIVIVGIGGLVLTPVTFKIEDYSETAVPWVVLLPLLSAAAIGISLRSAAPEIDSTGYRRLGLWRAAQVGLLSATALVSVVAVTSQLEGSIGQLAGVRNFIGFLGLSLLSGCLLGGRMAWLFPVVQALAAATIGNPTGDGPPWDWPVRVDASFGAFVVSVVLLLVGLATLAIGTRERTGDIDA